MCQYVDSLRLGMQSSYICPLGITSSASSLLITSFRKYCFIQFLCFCLVLLLYSYPRAVNVWSINDKPPPNCIWLVFFLLKLSYHFILVSFHCRVIRKQCLLHHKWYPITPNLDILTIMHLMVYRICQEFVNKNIHKRHANFDFLILSILYAVIFPA